MVVFTRRQAVLTLAAGLAACERPGLGSKGDGPAEGSLGWAVAGPWRIEPARSVVIAHDVGGQRAKAVGGVVTPHRV